MKFRRTLKPTLPARDPNEPSPEVLFSPLDPHAGSIYHTLVTTPDVQAVYQAEATQLEPATDHRPFFNQHTRWSSINLNTLRDLLTQERQGRMALEDRPIAEVTLLVLLVQTILIAAAFILLPLARFSRKGLRAPNRWRFLLYFAGLGLGFIMIEIALLGRFMLFLGQPVYTFAVVLASLLIFTGVGAYLAGRFRLQPRRALLRIVPVILLAPLGILLGTPFPTGLRIVSKEASALVPWSWGVNGFFTVIGSVTALILAMSFGFKAVLLAGALCYLVALAAMATTNKAFNQTAP